MSRRSLDEQIACVRREIMRRAEVTPYLVETGRLTWPTARYEQEVMCAVLQTLLAVQHGGNNPSPTPQMDTPNAPQRPRYRLPQGD
jgi:hypothetical protein